MRLDPANFDVANILLDLAGLMEQAEGWHRSIRERLENDIRKESGEDKTAHDYTLDAIFREGEAGSGYERARLLRRIAELKEACTETKECLVAYQDERSVHRESARPDPVEIPSIVFVKNMDELVADELERVKAAERKIAELTEFVNGTVWL